MLVRGDVVRQVDPADALCRLRRRLPRRGRIQVQDGGNRRVHADGDAIDDAGTGVRVGHVDSLGPPDRLSQPFVGDEVKGSALDQRAAGAGAELILAQGRVGTGEQLVEVVGGVEPVVAKELEQGTVPLVRSGFRDGVDRGAIAAELRAVRIGQHLVFRNRLDAKRRAKLTGAAAAIPVILDVRVIEQEDLSFGTRTGHGVLRLAAEKLLKLATCGRRRQLVGAWRQRNQLRIAAVDERQLRDLLLFDHGSQRG